MKLELPVIRALLVSVLLVFVMIATSGCEKVAARGKIKEGNDFYRAGKFEEAMARYDEAAKLDPSFPILYLHMGYASMALSTSLVGPAASKAADKAIIAFTKFMKMRPNDERGPKYYLQVLLDSGRMGEALEFLKRQHRQHPQDIKIVASLGVVSSKAGKFDEALKWYEKKAAMRPNDAQARYLIGTLCWEHLYQNASVVETARVKIADYGIDALKKAVKLQPTYAEALTYINLLYRERSKGQTDPKAQAADMDMARSFYKKAMALIKADAADKKSGKKKKKGKRKKRKGKR